MSKTVQIVMNPISGRGRGRRELPEIEAGLTDLGYGVRVFQTQEAGDARRFVEQIDSSAPPDVLLVIGGDGTINEAVNGLAARPRHSSSRQDIPMAIFPSGTSNVFCREVGIEPSVESLISVFARGEERLIDLGAAGDRRFLSVAGCGPDAYTVRALTTRRRGTIRMISYTDPILRMLLRYSFPPMSVEVDGEALTDNACAVVISNTSVYGGPLSMAPDAAIDDGLFDVVTLPKRTRLHIIKYLWGSLRGTLLSYPGVKHAQARHVKVETDAEDVPVQLDGDTAGRLPATFRILPEAQRLLLPAEEA